MTRVNIKPLSVNDAWQGKRFKTVRYKKYEQDVMYLLPKIKLPDPPYEVNYKFGFSSAASDIDNPVKPLQDILSKKYGFNDKLIRKSITEVEMVKKGQEYFEFRILSFPSLQPL